MSTLIGKPEQMKKINLTKILDLIRKEELISRADIAKELGISRQTVSKLIADLLLEKAVVEIGEGESNGGKRPIMIQINRESAFIIGIHLTYPVIKIALANNSGKILVRDEVEATSKIRLIEIISGKIKQLLRKAAIAESRLSIISVGVSAIVNPFNGEITNARIFPNLKGTHLKNALEHTFNVPVIIDNDVYMGVLSQAALIQEKSQNIAFVTIGELIGMGMMIEGKVYRGARMAAGEIGDMLIDSREQLADGFKPEGGYLERWLNWKEIERLYSVDEMGNNQPSQIISQYQMKIACCLANVICVFNPEQVFIGGKILQVNPIFLQQIESILKRLNGTAPKLEVANYKEDAELIGTIHSALGKLQNSMSLLK